MARTAPAAPDGCAAEPTPADRQICGDEELRRLQLELRQAYAEALDAHVDRALLRQRQLAWRDARNTVSDPTRLAQLYEQRVMDLHKKYASKGFPLIAINPNSPVVVWEDSYEEMQKRSDKMFGGK